MKFIPATDNGERCHSCAWLPKSCGVSPLARLAFIPAPRDSGDCPYFVGRIRPRTMQLSLFAMPGSGLS
jgi:hypothetical protein